MAEAFDVVVIGGGVVGAAIAYHLTAPGGNAGQRPPRVLVVDAAARGRATAAGAGIVTAQAAYAVAAARPPDPWTQLMAAAADYYPRLAARLAELGAGDTGYARCGELLLDVPRQAAAAAVSAAAGAARAAGAAAAAGDGGRGDEPAAFIDGATAQRLLPPLGACEGALYLRAGARVDGRQLAGALTGAAQQQGATVRQADVEGLTIADGRVCGVLVDGQEVVTPQAIVAGGAWSARFADQLQTALPVVPQRGQLVHLQVAGEDTSRWPVAFDAAGHYLVAWPGGRVVVGATHEPEAGFDAGTSAAGVREVLDHALRMAPGLAGAGFVEVRSGLRPVSADGMPFVGAVAGCAGAFVACGHGAVGLHLAPWTGKLLSDAIRGGPPLPRWLGLERLRD